MKNVKGNKNICKLSVKEKLNHSIDSFSGVDKTISRYPLDIIGVTTKIINIAESDFIKGLKPEDSLLFCQRYIIGKGIIKAKLNFVATAKPKKYPLILKLFLYSR